MEYKDPILRKVVQYTLLSRRQKLGLTQNALSITTNITRQFISQVEAGKKQPSIQTLGLVANAFGLSLTELFQEIDNLYAEYENNPLRAQALNIAAEHNKFATGYIQRQIHLKKEETQRP